jgi:hypothetical protein
MRHYGVELEDYDYQHTGDLMGGKPSPYRQLRCGIQLDQATIAVLLPCLPMLIFLQPSSSSLAKALSHYIFPIMKEGTIRDHRPLHVFTTPITHV